MEHNTHTLLSAPDLSSAAGSAELLVSKIAFGEGVPTAVGSPVDPIGKIHAAMRRHGEEQIQGGNQVPPGGSKGGLQVVTFGAGIRGPDTAPTDMPPSTTGQSPMDRQAGIAWTKAVMERFVSETVPITSLTAADLAREWVEAVTWVYDNTPIPIRQPNMLNAVGIAPEDDGGMRVCAIEPSGVTVVEWTIPLE